MYVCTCVCMYVCMYVCMHACKNTFPDLYMYSYMCIHVNICIMFIKKYLVTEIHLCRFACVHCVHVNRDTYTHVHIYMST